MEKLNIQNNSGDKEFFTIVPNFIINHSTAIDRALYLEMKRFAGEDGNCFTTEKTMMSRLAIGKKAFNKSLNYLLGKKWVEFVGITEGKTRPIKTYKINNIWQENSDYYKKISAESTLSQKDKFQKEGDKFQKHTKISAESTIEEDPLKEDILRRLPKGREANASSSFGNPLINQCIDFLKEQNCLAITKPEDRRIKEKRGEEYLHFDKNQNADSIGKQINTLISLFKEVNPSFERLFPNKSQREALNRLIKKHTFDKIFNLIKALPSIVSQNYSPRITSPIQLENKLGELLLFLKQKNNSRPTMEERSA